MTRAAKVHRHARRLPGIVLVLLIVFAIGDTVACERVDPVRLRLVASFGVAYDSYGIGSSECRTSSAQLMLCL